MSVFLILMELVKIKNRYSLLDFKTISLCIFASWWRTRSLTPVHPLNQIIFINPVYSYLNTHLNLQITEHREKFNSLHFPETVNGRGFDSHSEPIVTTPQT